ncbi:hypothetical protein H5410_038540 [Solanum commersonii]|uniref:Uncharacterized protein n=1 Tax=Solanum commersonii TaxID=4109 RepID=A0A9J5YDF9_SOLCO|nr:hypothetical protein H5410_038540 [Solanum commersonii]
MWLGPYPVILITDPEHLKEIFTKNYVYLKQNHPNPMTKLLAQGLANIEVDKWAKHRKIINPVFHVEKLKFNWARAMFKKIRETLESCTLKLKMYNTKISFESCGLNIQCGILELKELLLNCKVTFFFKVT